MDKKLRSRRELFTIPADKRNLMKYPDFFNHVPTITMYDPPSKLLGAFYDGMITYSYLDAVKLAGHSCPTVAGAYLMALCGIEALYKNEVPHRGQIIVTCKESRDEGVTGVIGNVFSLITGASAEEGFKGLKGRYSRNNLLQFKSTQISPFILERMDTHQRIALTYNPSAIATQPIPPQIMQAVFNASASAEEEVLFGQIWQRNVQTILEAHHSPDLILLEDIS